MINHNLKDQKYLFFLTGVKKKINIAKLQTKSNELRSETRYQTIPKNPEVEIICYLYDTKRVEYGKLFFLECPTHTHIRSQFQNICYNSDLPNILTHQIYGDLGMLFLKLFEHRNKILKQTK
jgi:hypothetical protein